MKVRVTFPNGRGQILAGILERPAGTPWAYALFAHCFACTKNLRAIGNISTALMRAGIAVLKFDFTGLGGSEGEFSEENFSSSVADLIAAARFLKEKYAAPRVLIGHSLGGTAVLHAAAQVPQARAIATIGSPAHATHIARLLRSGQVSSSAPARR